MGSWNVTFRASFAQGLTVKGVVKDNTGMGVIGANILVKGTTNGTITDFDGNFTLEAKKGDVIVISFIGYKTQELPAAATMNVTLQDDTEVLDDVVVIGYGSVRKDDATGSVTAIKPDKISKGVTTSPQDMITGKNCWCQCCIYRWYTRCWSYHTYSWRFIFECQQ